MSNVYLCYTGEYEDRGVCHAASTREPPMQLSPMQVSSRIISVTLVPL